MFSSYSAYLVKSVAGLAQRDGSAGYRQLDLRASSAYALHRASATMALPHGDVRFNWTRSGGMQYDKVSEGGDAHLSCGPRGGVITQVVFASFGTPMVGGDDGSAVEAEARPWRVPPLSVRATCHATSSHEVVTSRCVGRTHCTIAANGALFGFGAADAARCAAAGGKGPYDALSDPLRLWVAVTCSRPDAVDAYARVPIGSTATVRLPLRGMATPVLRDGARVVYGAGASAPADLTDLVVRREVDARVGEVLAVDVGSGEWDLALEAAA